MNKQIRGVYCETFLSVPQCWNIVFNVKIETEFTGKFGAEIKHVQSRALKQILLAIPHHHSLEVRCLLLGEILPFRVCRYRKWEFQKSRHVPSHKSVSHCQDLSSSTQKILKNVNLLRPCILLEGRQIHLKKKKKGHDFAFFPQFIYLIKTVGKKKSHLNLIKLTPTSFMIYHFIGCFWVPR